MTSWDRYALKLLSLERHKTTRKKRFLAAIRNGSLKKKRAELWKYVECRLLSLSIHDWWIHHYILFSVLNLFDPIKVFFKGHFFLNFNLFHILFSVSCHENSFECITFEVWSWRMEENHSIKSAGRMKAIRRNAYGNFH